MKKIKQVHKKDMLPQTIEETEEVFKQLLVTRIKVLKCTIYLDIIVYAISAKEFTEMCHKYVVLSNSLVFYLLKTCTFLHSRPGQF